MRFKIWLRGPANSPRAEVIGDWGWYWRSAHYNQREERSLMAELLTPEQVEQCQLREGWWFLPGAPP